MLKSFYVFKLPMVPAAFRCLFIPHPYPFSTSNLYDHSPPPPFAKAVSMLLTNKTFSEIGGSLCDVLEGIPGFIVSAGWRVSSSYFLSINAQTAN